MGWSGRDAGGLRMGVVVAKSGLCREDGLGRAPRGSAPPALVLKGRAALEFSWPEVERRGRMRASLAASRSILRDMLIM